MSQLKLFSGTDFPSVVIQLLDISLASQVPIIPVAFLNRRAITVKGGQLKSQVLIQWKGLPMKDSSWEDCDFIREMFPHFIEKSFWEDADVLQEVFPYFNLADQVHFDGEWNVTTQTTAEENYAEEESSSPRINKMKRIKKQPRWIREYVM